MHSKRHDGQLRLIHPAKLSATVEGEGKTFHVINSLKFYIQQTKPKGNTGKQYFRLTKNEHRVENSSKKRKATITKTQNTAENTNSDTGNRTVAAINSHLLMMTSNINCFNFLIKRFRQQQSTYLSPA